MKRERAKKGIWLALLLSAAFIGLVSCKGKDTVAANGGMESEGAALGTKAEYAAAAETFDFSDVPEYSGEYYAIIHDNIPFFTEEELVTEAYEEYSPLDELGRCGVCMACLGQELMPDGAREGLSKVKPSGWQTAQYDGMEYGTSLYNRSHLIAYSLAGENANERNLITGTNYMNVGGMNPFEVMTADYIRETGNHVIYRVTPVFVGENLVASGVLMEAESVEDKGEGILFCVYCYNVQPGIAIDYANGDNEADGTDDAVRRQQDTSSADGGQTENEEGFYVLNTRNMKFHLPNCDGVANMKPENREETKESREKLIEEGYAPCGACNP